MKAYELSTVSDRDVVAELEALVAREREVLAAVLAHLGEVEARRLYLPAACSSMHGYCLRVLGMSEDAAFKRLRVARAARRWPVLFEAIAEGRLHLSGAVMLVPHLTDGNALSRIREASGKSKADIAVLVATWAPKPDVAPRVEPIAEQTAMPVAPAPVAPGPPARTKAVIPLAPRRFELRATIGAETQAKLGRAKALLRHQVPSGDVAEVLDRALDALLEKVEKRKFGAAKAPRASHRAAKGRYVPRAARRAAVARDGERCSFVGDDGRRCDETGFLEMDHVVPVAHGGGSGAVRILCRAHNQYEAERLMGREAVERGRRESELEREVLSGLRNLGVTAADARAAVAASRGKADDVVERLRVSLRWLGGIYQGRRGARCEEPSAPYNHAEWHLLPSGSSQPALVSTPRARSRQCNVTMDPCAGSPSSRSPARLWPS